MKVPFGNEIPEEHFPSLEEKKREKAKGKVPRNNTLYTIQSEYIEDAERRRNGCLSLYVIHTRILCV